MCQSLCQDFFHEVFHVILAVTLRGGDYHHPHFSDEETKVQNNYVVYSRRTVGELQLKPRFSESRTTGCVYCAILHKYMLSHKNDGLFKKHPKIKRKSLFISHACVHVCAHAHKKIVKQPRKNGFVLWSFRMKVVNSIFACF